MSDAFARRIRSVVRNGNCTGCGGCTLISKRVEMALSQDGYMRPEIGSTATNSGEIADEVRGLRSVCPGVSLKHPLEAGPKYDPTFGSYYSAWQGAASDLEIRNAGSSAGVLTALSLWLVDSGKMDSYSSVAMNPQNPSRTVPVRIITRAEALASSGSRYAPVAALDRSELPQSQVTVGKPCEVSALRQFETFSGTGQAEKSIALSFFCAGVPSQFATDKLVSDGGLEPNELSLLKYRGDGWPGKFIARSTDGREFSTTYEESWGRHLGRQLQWRCKICPDGTGESADISVGDFWESDENGYPIFSDSPPNSAIFARTKKGHDLLLGAFAEGIVTLSPLEPSQVAAVQPLQVGRRQAVAGRLVGRMLAGYRIPRYSGYGILRLALESPIRSMRALAGTILRSIQARTRKAE